MFNKHLLYKPRCCFPEISIRSSAGLRPGRSQPWSERCLFTTDSSRCRCPTGQCAAIETECSGWDTRTPPRRSGIRNVRAGGCGNVQSANRATGIVNSQQLCLLRRFPPPLPDGTEQANPRLSTQQLNSFQHRGGEDALKIFHLDLLSVITLFKYAQPPPPTGNELLLF